MRCDGYIDEYMNDAVAGYLSLWQHKPVRFDDGGVLEMTASDAQVAIHRRTLPAAAAQKDAQQLLQEEAVTQTPLPRPSDLPRPAVFKKHTVWLMFTTGWGRGVLVKKIPGAGMFEAKFENDQGGRRNASLASGLYLDTQAAIREAEPGNWFLTPRLPDVGTEPQSATAEVTSGDEL